MFGDSKKNKKYEEELGYFLANGGGYKNECKKIDEREDLSEVEKYKQKIEIDFWFRWLRYDVITVPFTDVVWMFVYSVLFFALSIWIYRSFFEFSQDYTFYYVFALFSLAFFFFMISIVAALAAKRKANCIEDYLLDRMQMSEKHTLDLLKRVKELEKKNYRLEEEKRQREYDV